MRKNQIPVACVQLAAIDRGAFDERWAHVLALTESAAEHGARLIVLPEGTVPAYVLGTQAVSGEQLMRARADLAAIARRYGTTLVYGGVKIVGTQTFNAAVALGPDGRELGFAAKQFLWHFDRHWFAPGNTLEPVDTPAGRLGLLVCADGRIPTIAATLVERGAEMLVMPTAWVTSGRDPGALENIQADLMIHVRARENGVPFIAANKAGVELGAVAYCGKSAIVSADGTASARASERDEEILFGEVSVGRDATDSRASLPTGAALVPERAPAEVPRERARIAFTLERDPAELARLAGFCAAADVDLILAGASPSQAADGWNPRTSGGDGVPIFGAFAGRSEPIAEAAGLRMALVGDEIVSNPRGLVVARQADIDLIVWETHDDPEWQLRFARTRAAELRAYMVVFAAGEQRAFAVDPDGTVIAGTFGAYRHASFAYERARTRATLVAPATDVADGLRIAERIRSEGLAAARGD